MISVVLFSNCACLPCADAIIILSVPLPNDAGSDGGLDGDAPPAPAPPLADAPGDGGMEDAAEVFVEDAPPGQPLVGLPADIPWPARVLGQKLNTIKGRRGGGWSYEPRLSIACNNPADEGCSKSRSVAMDSVVFGRLAAVYFLEAWLQ